MIQGERQLAVPAVRPPGIADKRPKSLRVSDEIQKIVGAFERPQATPAAHQKPVGDVKSTVDCDVLVLIEDGSHWQLRLAMSSASGSVATIPL